MKERKKSNNYTTNVVLTFALISEIKETKKKDDRWKEVINLKKIILLIKLTLLKQFKNLSLHCDNKPETFSFDTWL